MSKFKRIEIISLTMTLIISAVLTLSLNLPEKSADVQRTRTQKGLMTINAEVFKPLKQKTLDTEKEEPEPRYNLTGEEKNMLCFIADKEDHSSVESRQAIMQVVMNRTESPKFPDNVYDVLYQKNQFSTMKRYGNNDYTPSDEALEALAQMLYGGDIFGGKIALFFSNASVNPSKIARGLYEVAEIGGTKFYAQK